MVRPLDYFICQRSLTLALAFILYRQANYEAAAAAQSHPVSSCTISKMLGREWNELPARTKAEWMSLAEVSVSRQKY